MLISYENQNTVVRARMLDSLCQYIQVTAVERFRQLESILLI